MVVKAKGAGDSEVRNNPPVHSKGQRHGHAFVPQPVSRVGGVAPMPGGNDKGREAPMTYGPHKVTHHAPSTLGSGMADGKRSEHVHNKHLTDSIRHPAGPEHQGSGMLDQASYVGARRGQGPSEK